MAHLFEVLWYSSKMSTLKYGLVFIDLLLSRDVEVLSVHSSEYSISDVIQFGRVHEELSSCDTSCALIDLFRPRLTL